MDFKSFLTYMILFFFVMGWWSNYKLRNKVLCYCIMPTKQEKKKWVSIKEEHVVFGEFQFDIVPDCATDLWYDEGLIRMMFPTWIKCYHFTWWNRFPENPNEFLASWEKPGVRKEINKAETMRGYLKNMPPSGEPEKKSLMQRYGVILMIVCVAILGFWAYGNFNNMNAHLAAIDNYLKALPPH